MKIWDSLRNIKSGFDLEISLLRLYRFRFIPSIFQEREVTCTVEFQATLEVSIDFIAAVTGEEDFIEKVEVETCTGDEVSKC